MSSKTTIARMLAPEDIRIGQYVTVLYAISEYLPTLPSHDDARCRSVEPIRVRWLPSQAYPPMEVKAVCLPHVFVRLPNNHLHTLDVRECEFGEVSREYARCVFTASRTKRKDRAKSKRASKRQADRRA